MEEEKNELKKQFIFNGKEFNNWKFRTITLLREHDTEEFIEKSLEEHEDVFITNLDDAETRQRKNKLKEELRKKERKCFSLIVQRIGNDYLEYVKDRNTPKEAWLSLCAAFERKGVSNRMFLRRQLLTLKMNDDDEDLAKHLLKFDKILRELKSVGAKMEEEDIICQLLLSLPNTFDQVATALETMKPEDLTLEFVKGRLLDCEIKRKTMTKTIFQQDSVAMVGYHKKQIKCYWCGKNGHFQNDCPDNPNRRFRNNCTNCMNCGQSQQQAQFTKAHEGDDRMHCFGNEKEDYIL